MLSERLQILIRPDQRWRLEAEAKRRRTSVASVIREAIDAQLGAVTREERVRAFEEIRAMGGGRFLPPGELNRIVEEERDEELPGRSDRGAR